MPNVEGSSWGDTPFTLGDAGGVVTWSLAGAGENVSQFGASSGLSVSGDSFLSIDYTAIIGDAFAEWSSHGNIEFMQVADPGGAAGSTDFADIRIFFGAIPGGTIGWAFFPYPNSAIAGDVLLDTQARFNWNTNEFRALVLHELGHSLGLGHVDLPVIMNGTINSSIFTLQTDDIAGIQQVYGAQDNGPTVYDMPTGRADIDILSAPDQVTINGNALSNLIDAADGAETLNGGDGDDTILGRGAADQLQGGAGNDSLDGGDGADLIEGGDDDDTLSGGADADTVEGGSGNDMALLGDGNDRYLLSTQSASDGNDSVTGGQGQDTIQGGGGADTLRGSDGNDLLLGGNQADLIFGGRGADTIRGGLGRDTIETGDGRDLFVDSAQNDAYGNDSVDGGNGNDTLAGRGGEDTLSGGNGNDRLGGGLKADLLSGGSGDDTVTGGLGRDIALLGDGDDLFVDAAQFDFYGADSVDGGAGRDTIQMGGGNDTAIGGADADRFVISSGNGQDVIRDFDATNDAEDIDLSAVAAITSISDLLDPGGRASQAGADVRIDTGNGNSLVLENVSLTDLGAEDFIF